MRNFLYKCPTTNFNVQGHVDADPDGPDHYVAQQCPICSKVHLVNPLTGKLLSEDYPSKKPR